MWARPSCCWRPRTETTAQDALEKVRIDYEPLPFHVDPLASLHPDKPNARTDGNVGAAGVEFQTLKWTREDFANAGGAHAHGQAGAGMDLRRRRCRLRARRSWCSTRPSCMPAIRTTAWSRARRMAYWQNGKCILHVSSQSQSFIAPALAGHDRHPAHRPGGDRRILRRWLRLQGRRLSAAGAAGAAVEEDQPPGDDAHQPRRGVLPRLRAPRLPGPGEAGLRRGRQAAGRRHLHRAGERRLQQLLGFPQRAGCACRCCTSPRPCAGAACRCTPTRPCAARSAARATTRWCTSWSRCSTRRRAS